MTSGGPDWLREGTGSRPQLVWSVAVEAPLVALQLARETGDILAADAVGGLYLIDRQGKLANVTRGPSPVRAIGWSETGTGGISLVGDEKLYYFDRQLTFLGCLKHSEPILAIALESHGHYAAASLSSGNTVIYDSSHRFVRKFGTLQPLAALEFLVDRPGLVGVSEFGLLCCHDFTGEQEWQTKLWANVSEMCVAGDGQTIFLASFSHGIQRYDASGKQLESYRPGGTVCRISSSFVPSRIAAATMERQFLYLDREGQVLWQTALPDDVCRVLCEPFGKGVICGMQSGRIVRLDWGQG